MGAGYGVAIFSIAAMDDTAHDWRIASPMNWQSGQSLTGCTSATTATTRHAFDLSICSQARRQTTRRTCTTSVVGFAAVAGKGRTANAATAWMGTNTSAADAEFALTLAKENESADAETQTLTPTA